MIKTLRAVSFLFALAILMLTAAIIYTKRVSAQELMANDRAIARPIMICPEGIRCKVLIISEGEEDELLRPNGVLDTALRGRSLDMMGFVPGFILKVQQAPLGGMCYPPSASASAQ